MKAPEAPHLYRIGGYWYLLIAEGGTERGHGVSIARSTAPTGPFEPCPDNPILTHRGTDHPIQNTGHGDLVQGPDGSWWLVLLGVRPRGGTRLARARPRDVPRPGDLGRRLAGRRRPGTTTARLPRPLQPTAPAPVRDDFDADALHPNWVRAAAADRRDLYDQAATRAAHPERPRRVARRTRRQLRRTPAAASLLPGQVPGGSGHRQGRSGGPSTRITTTRSRSTVPWPGRRPDRPAAHRRLVPGHPARSGGAASRGRRRRGRPLPPHRTGHGDPRHRVTGCTSPPSRRSTGGTCRPRSPWLHRQAHRSLRRGGDHARGLVRLRTELSSHRWSSRRSVSLNPVTSAGG